MIPDELLEFLESARARGDLGPPSVSAHVSHALAMVRAAEELLGRHPSRIVDLGTGGGVPGLVLAVCFPEAEVHLVEIRRQRADHLLHALRDLSLTNRVSVDCVRAEAFARTPGKRGSSHLVTARSFSGPAVTLECAAPLLAPNGVALVAEPPTDDGSRWPPTGLALLGMAQVRAPAHLGHRIAAFRPVARANDKYPRRTGVPAKRPLW